MSHAATRLKGGAGPCGVTGRQLKEWLLRHKVSSERLREELALWADLLANGSPPNASYWALNACRGLPADKLPGVRPLCPGKGWMRLISKCVMEQVKTQATAVCGNVQLCGGMKCGIEANLHALRAIWPQCAG